MKGLLELLKSFNRKERFFLIGQALGNQYFVLSDSFKKKIDDKLELNIPSNAFVAMDYHIDWIFASLFLFANSKEHPPYKTDCALTATQEDVDLLIAYKDVNLYHLILIEAKADTNWSNKQLNSKAKRFIEIFGFEGNKWGGIIPHFLIMSPNESKKLNINSLPAWMILNNKIPWVQLNWHKNLIKVTRCNKKLKKDKKGGYWKVENRNN